MYMCVIHLFIIYQHRVLTITLLFNVETMNNNETLKTKFSVTPEAFSGRQLMFA